jgi:putative ATPase
MSQTAMFGDGGTYGSTAQRPLADVLRPDAWDQFEGSDRIDGHLLRVLQAGEGRPPSLIIWGPPGCGKTTLARLVGKTFRCDFVEFSAVLQGVKDVREIVQRARQSHRPIILFVDEIHRFNKTQQDAFLPHVERGTIVLIGATTENPSFVLNGALLSRAKVLTLNALSDDALFAVLSRAAESKGVQIDEDARTLFVKAAGGDARAMLNALEDILGASNGAVTEISKDRATDFFKSTKTLFYDRSGEEHYNMVSAFIKSMRGSDPDAALYWGFRMLESGEDPRFVIRRMIIFASEDIGNADPRALQVATATADAFERLGFPEGRIPIAQCMTYLASAPKSNRSYKAMYAALAAVQEHPKVSVPLHLRNAPTKLMKELGYGENYAYPHENEVGFVPGVQYLPDEVGERRFYEPADRGYEVKIGERLRHYRQLGASKKK